VPEEPTHQDESFDRFFWEGCREGKLLAQRCSDCGVVRHPPSPMCAGCRSLATEVVELSGRGTLHSWILSHHPSRPDEPPRIVALVQLEEGPRLVSNLVGMGPADVRNDMAVEVLFSTRKDFDVPQFRALSEPGSPTGRSSPVAQA
jgi:uncharacterized OB-fold protein